MGTPDVTDGSGQPAASGAADESGLCYPDRAGREQKVVLSAAIPLLVVGRASDADVSLPWDLSVSKLHAIVELMGSHWTIVDNGLSRNGTFVNGKRLTGRRRLQPGDGILIGDTLFTYHGPSGVRQPETRQGGLGAPEVVVTDAQLSVLVALCRPFEDNTTFATPAPNLRIAEELHLSEATVKTHLRELFIRLGVDDAPRSQKRARLAERAMQTHLVPGHDS